MKVRITRAITPVWAQRIEVERQRDALLITGWGHIPNPLSAQRVPPEKQPRLDILKRLHGYALRQLGQPRGDAGVYQFADATDDEKLIAFAKEFGPVRGVVLEFKPETNGTWTLTVREALKSLRYEQRQFAALVQIVQQVNRNKHADFAKLDRLLEALEMDMAKTYDWFRAMEDLIDQGYFTSKSSDLLPMAHKTLCIFLNHYPPKLIPLDGEVIELPDVNFTGIRDALYFQLRLDYLAQRTIGTCLHCGNHFPVFKRGTRGCSDACGRALRNQKYWNKNRKTINKQRRTDRVGEK